MVKFAALATHHPEIGILPEDGEPARLEVVGVPHAVENAQMELQQHRQGTLVMSGNIRNCFLAAPILAFGDILLHCCMFRNHKCIFHLSGKKALPERSDNLLRRLCVASPANICTFNILLQFIGIYCMCEFWRRHIQSCQPCRKPGRV